MCFDFFRVAKPQREFHPAHSLEGFETPQKADEERRILAALLREGGAAQRQLGAIISRCQKGDRCRSAACRVCGRNFRVRFAGHLAQIIAAHDDDWRAVSLVPSARDTSYAIGELHQFDSRKFKDRIRKQLARSELAAAPVVIGIDFAVQTFKYPIQPPLWRPHAYMLIGGYTTPQIHTALDSYYPPGPRTPRPIYSRKIDKKTLLKVTSYAFKCEFFIRQPWVDEKGNADTRNVPLETTHLAELAPLLHKWGFNGRVLLRGFSRVSDSTGKISLSVADPFDKFVRGSRSRRQHLDQLVD